MPILPHGAHMRRRFSILCEKSYLTPYIFLANSTKFCYTYDKLSRVAKRTVKNLSDVILSEEAFTYDAAGNITGGSADNTGDGSLC